MCSRSFNSSTACRKVVVVACAWVLLNGNLTPEMPRARAVYQGLSTSNQIPITIDGPQPKTFSFSTHLTVYSTEEKVSCTCSRLLLRNMVQGRGLASCIWASFVHLNPKKRTLNGGQALAENPGRLCTVLLVLISP